MSQEHPPVNPFNEHSNEEASPLIYSTFVQREQLPSFPWVDASPSAQTPGCYWRLFNDHEHLPPGASIGHLIVFVEAFLSLMH